MDSIKITLETLYDLFRNEKKREDLQKLEGSFFLDLAAYVREKKMMIEQHKGRDDVFSTGEKEKLDYELRSINRILKELYEKREKKIIDIALNKSRTSSDIIDTSSMLLEEKEFYEKVLGVLDTYRRGVLYNLTRGELPDINESKTMNSYSYAHYTKDNSDNKKNTDYGDNDDSDDVESKKETSTDIEENKSEEEITKIRFKRPVPRFVWKGGKTFGPFDPNEEMEFPAQIAELLIRKDRAEKI